MEEAEYCDRVAIMDAGRVLAQGTPAEIRGRARSDQRQRAEHGRRVYCGGRGRLAQKRRCDAPLRGESHEIRNRETQRLASAKLHRIGSLIRKEARQIVRDPSSIAIGIVYAGRC